MKKLLFTLTAALVAGATTALAAISVGPDGSGVLTFDTFPPVTEWSTAAATGDSASITTAAQLDAAVQSASIGVTGILGMSATVNPAPSANAYARWNSVNLNLQIRPTTVAFTILVATLQNDTGSTLSSLLVRYQFNALVAADSVIVEDVPGLRVFYSLTGAANSWQLIPELSAITTPTLAEAVVNLGAWEPGAPLYILWADDNGPASDTAPNREAAYTLDNVEFSTGGTVPFGFITPTNGQSFVEGVPVPVSVSAASDIVDVTLELDGAPIEFDDSPPFQFSLTGLSLGQHTLAISGETTSGDTSNAGPILITIVPNGTPLLSITNSYLVPVAPGGTSTVFRVGSSIFLASQAFDDLGLQGVDWFVDGEFYIGWTNAPYDFVYADARAGEHTIYGIATDVLGLQTTSPNYTLVITNPPAQFSLLVTNGSDWKYYSVGAAPPTDGGNNEWYQPGYDAEEWPSGLAELGYGDAVNGYPETTLIPSGPANDHYITAYFRKSFNLDSTDFVNLVINLMRDDGAVVYLNGVGIWTNNMPTGPITYNTFAATTAADDGLTYFSANISPNLLVAGENVLAVEVHQSTNTSSDISFDLMLWGEGFTAPLLVITAPANGQVVVASSDVTVTTSASSFLTNVIFYLDGAQVAVDASAPFSTVLPNISAGGHTIRAIGHDSFGDSVTSAVVAITATANQPPVVQITNTFSGSYTGLVYLVGSVVTNLLSVTDDVGIASVQFLVDNALYLTRTNNFSPWILNDAWAGTHVLKVVATDNAGLSSSASVTVSVTNPPLAILITNHSAWRYLDIGNAPPVVAGKDWTQPGYDDFSWSTGLADIGFGNGADYPEWTVIDGGPATNRNSAVYFRKTISVPDPSAYTNLIGNLLRDDGGIVFVNGVEAYRNNMPAGVATYATLASAAAADDGTVYQRFLLSPANFIAGVNTIAVEIHQSALTSSDLSFDFMLAGAGSSVTQPTLNIAIDDTKITVSWVGSGFQLQQTPTVGPANWQNVPGNPQNLYSIPLPAPGQTRFFQLIDQ